MVRRLDSGKYFKTAVKLVSNCFYEVNPFYASLKVTGCCQFSCEFCNVWKTPSEDLPTEDMKKIIRNLGQSSIVLISFEGGEPLLRKDIEELLREARQQPFYVMLTTSQKRILDYPWHRYQDSIDFLQVSIDEGHNNLDIFKLLPELNRYEMEVCVQTVVRSRDIFAMRAKAALAFKAGCRILYMPAVNLKQTTGQFPEIEVFEKELGRLKRAYPNTIITPDVYFKRLKKRQGGCSPNSIVVDSDGCLYYPCRPLEQKTIKLHETNLMEYLHSSQAARFRKTMRNCTSQCGWYQYFALAGLARPQGFWHALRQHMLKKTA
ncbi:MAG: radical SAM protein [Fibrobacteria bacterium]|nr:radical SAM protein [Fibrobacteria bacterium]